MYILKNIVTEKWSLEKSVPSLILTVTYVEIAKFW